MASNLPPHVQTFPRGDLASARLAFTGGVAPRLDLRGAPLGDALARCAFGDPAPRVELRGDELTIDYRGFWRWFFAGRPAPGTLELNDALPWSIDVEGGAAKVDIDLRSIDLRRLELGGGAAKIELRLGRPVGIVPVRISGGAARLRVTHPRGVASRLRVTGGAVHVEFDGQSLGAVGGGLALTSREWDEKGDGYDIKVGGGAAHLSVEPDGPA